MYLIDTNVISELRNKRKANPGVLKFFQHVIEQEEQVYISVITIGELRRGVELIKRRGDRNQSELLEMWLLTILRDYSNYILDFSESAAQVWGRLRVPDPQHAIDKQIAATALSRGLTLVTRNVRDFEGTGVVLLNPFESDQQQTPEH